MKLVLSLLVIALVGGSCWWAGSQIAFSRPTSIDGQPHRVLVTAPIVRRVLSENLDLTGSVTTDARYSVDIGMMSVPNAVPIVTAPPVAVGVQLGNGNLITQVAGRPVFVFAGSTPMYREIVVGNRGEDVAQLQADLGALGYATGDSPGYFGASTQAAVYEFYIRSGFAPASNGNSSIAKSTTKGSTQKATATPSSKWSDVAVPQAEIVFVPSLPAIVVKTSEIVGQVISNPAIELSAGRLIASIGLSTAQTSLVHVGQSAEIVLSSTGQSFPGKVSKIFVNTTSSGITAVTAEASPNLSLPAKFAGRSVTVNIAIQSTITPVIAVPISALIAQPNGATAIEILNGTFLRKVVVRVGGSIGGYIPIIPVGATVKPGEMVVVG